MAEAAPLPPDRRSALACKEENRRSEAVAALSSREVGLRRAIGSEPIAAQVLRIQAGVPPTI